ncbi:serine/threonine-protein phosphatase 6 regulatory ankyrin repeat subunit B-like isoform X1 [Paramyrothecium foliicola]|nr:serine/threonine-protein phosphatase 6 regulatory ankyrin repeat subunit B-like isoform X1 [Paramyrothecium foliicola]
MERSGNSGVSVQITVPVFETKTHVELLRRCEPKLTFCPLEKKAFEFLHNASSETTAPTANSSIQAAVGVREPVGTRWDAQLPTQGNLHPNLYLHVAADFSVPPTPASLHSSAMGAAPVSFDVDTMDLTAWESLSDMRAAVNELPPGAWSDSAASATTYSDAHWDHNTNSGRSSSSLSPSNPAIAAAKPTDAAITMPGQSWSQRAATVESENRSPALISRQDATATNPGPCRETLVLVQTAVQNGSTAILQMLIDHHVPTPGNTLADFINYVDDMTGSTFLHTAIEHQRIDCARLLVDNGASVLQPDKEGKTPLLLAVSTGFEAGVRLLLSQVRKNGCPPAKFP